MEAKIRINGKSEVEMTFDGDSTNLEDKEDKTQYGKVYPKQSVVFTNKETALIYFNKELAKPKKAINDLESELSKIKIDEDKFRKLVEALKQAKNFTSGKYSNLDKIIGQFDKFDRYTKLLEENKKEFVKISNWIKEIENLK